MEKNNKKALLIIKHICTSAGSVLVAGMVGMLILLIISWIPQKTIYENAKESVERLRAECTDYSLIYNRIKGGQLDYFTDFLIVNTCFYSAGNAKDTILGARVTGDGGEYIDPICRYFAGDISSLESGNYERYWHGYMVFLRPALVFGNLKIIRTLSVIINLVLTVVVVILLVKRKEGKAKNLIIPFLAFVVSLSPIAVSFSLQYYPVFYSTMFSIILILLQKDNLFLNNWYIFLCTGIIVGFFDLLTYPLVSLGVPLIMILALYSEEKHKLINEIVKCFMYSVSWAIGYFGIIMFRWISSSFISGTNIIADGFDRFLYRSSHEFSGVELSLFETLKVNISEQCNALTIAAVAGSVIIAFVLIPFFHSKVNYISILTILIICFYPVLWYYALMQHSNLHFWMTYRNMSITIFGMLALLFSFLDFRRKKISVFIIDFLN